MLISASGANAAFAQTAAAPDAMSRYRALTSVAPKPCSKATDSSEIIVCTSKLRESQRVPYIEETRVGDRPRRAYGEPPGQDPGPPCPIRGCPCPPTECGIRALAKKILGGD